MNVQIKTNETNETKRLRNIAGNVCVACCVCVLCCVILVQSYSCNRALLSILLSILHRPAHSTHSTHTVHTSTLSVNPLSSWHATPLPPSPAPTVGTTKRQPPPGTRSPSCPCSHTSTCLASLATTLNGSLDLWK